MDDLDHLINALQQHYEITVDMDGKQFCGLYLEWNHPCGYRDISMPNYVNKKLKNSIIKNQQDLSMPRISG